MTEPWVIMAASVSYHQKKKDLFVPVCCFSLILGILLCIPVGAFFAVQVGLTLSTGVCLFRFFYAYGMHRLWTRIAVELFVPGVLWVLFGVGGLLTLWFNSAYSKLGVPVEDSTVFLTSIYMMVGMGAYWLTANRVYRKGIAEHEGSNEQQDQKTSRKYIVLLTLLLLGFDWIIRFQQIKKGVYVTWISTFSEYNTNLQTNTLYHIQDDIHLILIPLLIYLYAKSRVKMVYLLLLAVHSILMILRGDRGDILLGTAIAVLAVMLVYQKKIRLRLLFVGGLALLFFLTAVSPIIAQARMQLRRDAYQLLKNPVSVISSFPSQYLWEALQTGATADGVASSIVRFSAYMTYAASINQVLLDGRSGLRMDELGQALLVLIPRIIYPAKPTIYANDAIYIHFGFGTLGRDDAGSPVADIFSYLHLPGVIILMSFAGFFYTSMALHLQKNYGLVGKLIFLGVLPTMLYPGGHSFVGYLASMRTAVILLAVMKILSYLDRMTTKHQIVRVYGKQVNWRAL